MLWRRLGKPWCTWSRCIYVCFETASGRFFFKMNDGWTEWARARFFRVVLDDLIFHEEICKIYLISSSHRLREDPRGWGRPVIPYESRLCTICHKLYDGFHFLLECSRYHDIRWKYFLTYGRINLMEYLKAQCRRQSYLAFWFAGNGLAPTTNTY